MSQPSNVSLSYRDAGVDIDAGDALVEAIKPFAKRTMREILPRGRPSRLSRMRCKRSPRAVGWAMGKT